MKTCLATAIALVLACSAPEPAPLPFAEDAGSPAPACRTYAPARRVGTVAHPALKEISGIAASRSQPGVLFVHNDSGDRPRFFAIDETGRTLGEFELPGAAFTDVEDVALAPCGSGDCLYFGDIGDNLARRDDYAIYRVPEPLIESAQEGARPLGFETLRFTYPDGSHDAETLVAGPGAEALYVITKAADGSEAWALSASAGVQTAVHVGPVRPPDSGVLLTGGSLHPRGDRLLLRGYGALYELRADAAGGFARLLEGTWRSLPPPDEVQGEAVTWLGDGSGYITVPEEAGAPIHRVDCR